MAQEMVNITKLARVIRSKNASPFLSTMDFFFDEGPYRTVKDSGVVTREHVAKLLGVPLDDVIRVQFHDVARGIKISVIKPGGTASGDPGTADVFGAQQYIPLLALEIPVGPKTPGA